MVKKNKKQKNSDVKNIKGVDALFYEIPLSLNREHSTGCSTGERIS